MQRRKPITVRNTSHLYNNIILLLLFTCIPAIFYNVLYTRGLSLRYKIRTRRWRDESGRRRRPRWRRRNVAKLLQHTTFYFYFIEETFKKKKYIFYGFSTVVINILLFIIVYTYIGTSCYAFMFYIRTVCYYIIIRRVDTYITLYIIQWSEM